MRCIILPIRYHFTFILYLLTFRLINNPAPGMQSHSYTGEHFSTVRYFQFANEIPMNREYVKRYAIAQVDTYNVRTYVERAMATKRT